MDRDRIRLGGRQPGRERIVDEETPDVPVRDMADQFLDVNAAVPERAAFLVRLGDFRLEGDDPFKSWLEVRHRRFLSSSSRMLPGGQGILYHALDETGRPSRDFGPAGPRTRVPAGFQRYHST